jgi:hypothetical protein
MKIESYKTLFAKTPMELDQFVKLEIDRGFQPFGNQYFREGEIAEREGKSFFYQAMVREETEKLLEISSPDNS